MYLEVLKKEEKFGSFFRRLRDREKGMNNIFSSYKLTRKLSVVYLEVKL